MGWLIGLSILQAVVLIYIAWRLEKTDDTLRAQLLTLDWILKNVDKGQR